MVPLLIGVFGFGSAAMLGLAAYPPLMERIKGYLRQRSAEASFQLDDMFLTLSSHRLQLMYLGLPAGLALVCWLATGFPAAAVLGLGIGIPIPKFLLKQMKSQRRRLFQAQLVDSLLLISSCLRAGLSMVQSFNVVAEEMPAPIGQEFGLLLKETRMGISLDEAMLHFRQRMPSDDSNLFVTAVLVSRETGGDVTAIFTRLVDTLRERKKIKEKIKTLTFMAKLQGIVMGLLPLAFIYITYTTSPTHFQFFLKDSTGQMMLLMVVVGQIIGFLLFLRFSRSPL